MGMGIGDRIKEARESKGVKQSEIAQLLGVSSQAISNYESGIRDPKIEMLVKIAKYLDVSLDYIVKGNPYEIDVSDSLPQAVGYGFGVRQIPIVGRITAGRPLFAIENVEGFFPSEEVNSEDYFFLKVIGDSMRELRIYEDDMVLIKRQSSAKNNDIVVAILDGYETVLKTYSETEHGVWLMPANPAYKSIFLAWEAIDANPDKLKIEGVAVKLLANL